MTQSQEHSRSAAEQPRNTLSLNDLAIQLATHTKVHGGHSAHNVESFGNYFYTLNGTEYPGVLTGFLTNILVHDSLVIRNAATEDERARLLPTVEEESHDLVRRLIESGAFTDEDRFIGLLGRVSFYENNKGKVGSKQAKNELNQAFPEARPAHHAAPNKILSALGRVARKVQKAFYAIPT